MRPAGHGVLTAVIIVYSNTQPEGTSIGTEADN